MDKVPLKLASFPCWIYQTIRSVFMSFEVLSFPEHGQLHLSQPAHPLAFAQKQLLVSLLAAELSHAIHFFPLFFTLTESKADLVALLGISENQNLFVGPEGRWATEYVPAVLRAWPLLLSPKNQTGEQQIIIATDSDWVSKTAGDALFDHEGKPSPKLQEIIAFLQTCATNQSLTERSLDALVAADILVPWETTVSMPDGSSQKINGLYCIDAERFDALDSDGFNALRTEGALPLIYGHFFSLLNIKKLERMARERAPAVIPNDVAFGVLTDDYLKF